MTIPYRPNAYPGESAASLLIRTANMNGHLRVNHLLGEISRKFQLRLEKNITPKVFESRAIYLHILQFLGLCESNVGLIMEIYGHPTNRRRDFCGISLATNAFNKDASAFCPSCLEASPHWRQVWLLKVYKICTIHSQDLIRGCPACGHELPFNRGTVYKCHECDFDLRNAQSPLRDKEIATWLQATIMSDGLKLLVDVFAQLDRFLSACSDGYETLEIAYLYITRREDAVKKVVNILADGQMSLHPDAFLPILSNPEFRLFGIEVLSGIGDFLNTIFKGHPGYVSGRRAMLLLDLRSNSFAQLIEEKLITPLSDGSTPKYFLQDVWLLINHPKTEMLRECDKQFFNQLSNTVSPSEACQILDQPRRVIYALVKLGYLSCLRTGISGLNSMRINSAALNSFNIQFILIGALARDLNIKPTVLPGRLSSLNIHPVCDASNGLASAFFARCDLEGLTREMVASATHVLTKYTDRGPSIEWVSEYKAAKLLGIGPWQLSSLVREKLLIQCVERRGPPAISIESIGHLNHQINREDLVSLEVVCRDAKISTTRFRSHFIETSFVCLIDLKHWELISREDYARVTKFLDDYMSKTEASVLLELTLSSLAFIQSTLEFESVVIGEGSKAREFIRRKDIHDYILQHINPT